MGLESRSLKSHSISSYQYLTVYNRQKREISPLVSASISQISRSTSALKSAYLNNELQTVGDVAYTIIESIPVVGDIVSILTSKPEEEVTLEDSIQEINKNLEELNQEIIDVGDKVDQLSRQLDLSLLQKQVADDVRNIRDCYENFLFFLQKPTMIPEQDRLITCYDKFGYVREVGNILNNAKITFSQKPLFDQLIDNLGYCNGSQINSVFKYLLGIYIEGCTATVAAESLKYNKTSTTYLDECQRIINKSQSYIPSVYSKCELVSCDKIYKVIGSIAQELNTSRIPEILSETFPWFYFTVVIFTIDHNPDVKFYSGKLNHLSLTSRGTVYRAILWLPFMNRNTHGQYQYGIEYNQLAFLEEFNDIGLISIRGTKRSSLIGFHLRLNSSGTNCENTMDVGDLGIKSHESKSLSGVAVAMITVGCVAIFVTCVIVLYCCYKRRCRDEDDDEGCSCLDICLAICDGGDDD